MRDPKTKPNGIQASIMDTKKEGSVGRIISEANHGEYLMG
ncbi:uncharacterized protein G2W53_024665 [Senna tora]|uniref:Uncharacterized protein n=1 Tax=Senna tora TaxID=362788 RepID=A0A834TCE7_9FABA|nr:uncharacterized protein G2W53_024665 [Senna tora]